MFICKTDGWIQLYTCNCSLKCEKYKVRIKVYLGNIFVMLLYMQYYSGTLEKMKDISSVL